MKKKVSLTFLGAAETVTGSKHLLSTPDFNILIDCGLYQGLKQLRDLNWRPLPYEPENINVVLLTHAHLDHCGYLPVLFKNGYSGKIICTEPTKDLAELILRDSAKLQMEDADLANKEGWARHSPAKPLYDTNDVEAILPHFVTKKENEWFELNENIRYRFQKNGHILGATFIEIECYGKMIVFSGDIGRKGSITLNPPLKPKNADFVIMESTYGNRLHSHVDALDELEEVINEAFREGGSLLIPSFAVGRAQELLVLINQLMQQNRIRDVQIFLDTPMGTLATQIYERHKDWHKISHKILNEIDENVTFVTSIEHTHSVIERKGNKIIVAASGMLSGGRVLEYLMAYLPESQHTILLSGFQAEGTRGRDLLKGVPELKIHGNYYEVKAKVAEISSLSAHADQKELIEWLGDIKTKPQVFLVHGEPSAMNTLRIKLEDTLGLNVIIPERSESVDLFTLD